MNPRILFLLLLIGLAFLSSCLNDQLSSPDMPEVRFTELKAAQHYLQPNTTTTLAAIVENKCNLVGFEWSCDDGRIEGREGKVTFVAPEQSGTVQVSCTVTHPGREPLTKTITIHVK
jgi:hypothetical protein